MKLNKKLILSFTLISFFVIVVGFVGMINFDKFHENSLLSGSVTNLVLTQEEIEESMSSIVFLTDLNELEYFITQFNEEKEEFTETLFAVKKAQFFEDDLIQIIEFEHKNFVAISSNIISLQNEKITQQIIFNDKYSVEKSQRYDIRTSIFPLDDSSLTKNVGDVQYYSKETLYQHKDQKHLDEWLGAIYKLKENLLKNEHGFSPENNDDLLTELDEYEITAQTMGEIVIRQVEINLLQQSQISNLQEINDKVDIIGQNIIDELEFNNHSLVNSTYFFSILIILVSVGASSVIGIFISKNIAKPIHKLQNAAIEITQGNLDVNLEVSGSDEISSLSDSFNKMITSISESQKNVEERIRAESELEQVEKFNKILVEKEQKIKNQLVELTLLDKQKSEFLAVVSHELRTPLVPIRGNCEVLLDEDNPEQLSDNQTSLIESISSNSERLSELIHKILLTQRIGLGKQDYIMKDLNVKKLIDEIFQSYSSTMEKKQIRFETLVKDNLMVNCDKKSVTEILQSLLNNAIDFVTENGNIEIGAKVDSDSVIIFVKDNGIGIPLEKQNKLFTPFYQVDSSLGRKHQGTGLGLSICKDLVQGMGGKIWLESKGKGKGATFYFSLKKGDKK